MTSANAKILIVDSDDNLSELLRVNLGSEGYDVECAATAADALKRHDLSDFNLIITDSMDEELTGIDLIDRVKNDPTTTHISFILISDYRTEHDVVDALDAGADDYMVKPISLREMMARAKAVLRRRQARAVVVSPSSVLTYRTLHVDLLKRFVSDDGQEIVLTRTEFAILELLLRSVGHYVSRIEIHHKVWPDETEGANERKVDTNISRLRKKLGQSGQYLASRSGLGYMFTSENAG